MPLNVKFVNVEKLFTTKKINPQTRLEVGKYFCHVAEILFFFFLRDELIKDLDTKVDYIKEAI